MNKQEAFETAITGIIKQGRPSMGSLDTMHDTPGCKYKGRHDCKCAVGQLLPGNTRQEVWNAQMNVYLLLETFPEVRPHLLSEDVDVGFLTGLQQIHDYNSSTYRRDPARWLAQFETRAHVFARENGLSVDFMEKING